MLWFKGDVYDAVNNVKESQNHLFVSVRDENTSQTYLDILENNAELHDILKNSICLNLLKDSIEYKQFSEVYKVTVIPSIFIITYLGEVVDIIQDIPDQESLCIKLRNILGLETKEENPTEESQSPNSATNVNERNETVNFEDKMVEVKRILAEKHKQKAEEEKQKDKEDELKRRDLGKQLHQLKQTQKEREDEELKAELKRKRNEEKELRDKILRQIEEDKLERKQRFANQTATKIVNESDDVVINRELANDSTVRFLFRFPDGSSINHKFDINDKFFVVREFVAEHIRKNIGYYDIFEIRQFFPRQTISTTNDVNSLLDLKLFPSASFAVLFIKKPNNSGQVTNYLSWMVAPINFVFFTILSIFEGIKNWFTGGGAAPRVNTESNTNKPLPNSSNWEERQKRLLAAQSRTIKKDGNLAGFSDALKKEDDDEDEARWNGNSTQQM